MYPIKVILFFLLFYFMPIAIYCQIDLLDIDITNACFYSTKAYPEEYYIYNQDKTT
jgi:hypothetical protein